MTELTVEIRNALRAKFPKELIGKLPKTAKRPELDYVGHAAVTDRLNNVVPDWTYTIDQTFQVGESFWIRGTMTIGGVSRTEYGDGDDPKEAIGNFIRRGAMRFGVAIDLWSKEELETSGPGSGAPAAPDSSRDKQRRPGGRPAEPVSDTDGGQAESGEGQGASSAAAPSPGRSYPADPLGCSHKFPSGRWLTWDDEDRCPKCGTPKVAAIEGTTKDLG